MKKPAMVVYGPCLVGKEVLSWSYTVYMRKGFYSTAQVPFIFGKKVVWITRVTMGSHKIIPARMGASVPLQMSVTQEEKLRRAIKKRRAARLTGSAIHKFRSKRG